MDGRTDLFPVIEMARSGMLPLDGGHVMYWEETGNPDGLPVLFLHGGPGAGCTPAYRRFFDPLAYRILLFDQRGAGRSTPGAETQANTTQHLVCDIETLRRHLSVDRWLVFGGSWGSTLALAYGQAHPERCLGFVLRGVFLGRQAEIDWFLHGMGKFFPEAYRAFVAPIPKEERGAGLLAAYHRRLMDPDPCVHLPVARAWSRYESACSALRPGPADTAAVAGDRTALGLARLEAYYFMNGLFLRDGQLLDDLHRIESLPVTIVQGRYDVVCPIATADQLARAWPGADYSPVAEAGHSAMEFGIRAALVTATERMKYRLAAMA
ncbi:MAG: prolyl aminopeptidase [Alphaproteobacteria bacterium]|nr:prolyl aminopeptidase [Alphaproteobacteria bacterium]MCY4319086.1 prolyl aminopeptidase [Alphaproteobacteria bacterium]